jgi:eukaryotic-like serine/threonine-protein kinase
MAKTIVCLYYGLRTTDSPEGYMELTVQNVYGLLLRSKLLSLDDAKDMYARWQQEAKDTANNLAKFASWMVANKYLTEFQAQLLARGHADGFFLNEYKVLDRLGKGRMAGVYKAKHQLGQTVAIKVLPLSKSKDATLLGRFHRESRLALRLKHPNIVRSFQTGVAGGLNFLVMEYLEGETLEDVIGRRDKLSSAEAVRLIYQALQGLQHIHDQGLIHRDLKPSNLMLVGSEPDNTLRATLKVLDIGLGRTLFEEGMGEPGDPSLTTEGAFLGTPDYMAPEQARDPRNADIRADIYSLGCVLYQLLTGQPPFPDTNIISQMIRHATEMPKTLKEFNSAVPDGLQQIVNWMLAKDPAQRYPTPERAAQAMQVFLGAGAEQLAAPEADPRMKPYLSWLEIESGKQPILAAVTVDRPTASQPDKPLKLPNQAGTSGQPERGRTDKRPKDKRRSTPLPPREGTSSPVPVAEIPVRIDVELVPADPPPPATEFLQGLRLGLRDAIVFGIGAFSGALVTFVGYLIAHLVRSE